MIRLAHTRRRITTTLLLLLAATLLAGLLLGGCSGAEPLDQPPAVDEEALRKEAEERARQEEEARKLAEQRRLEEERRQREEMMALFGPIGEPPPQGPLPEPEVSGIPFDEAVPPLPPEPTVRVAVLNHDGDADTGRRVALIIGTYERERLEEDLGMAVKIAYVAQVKRPPQRLSEVRYRPDFLRAAQSVARVLPAEQWIGPMTDDERRQEGVDVVVHLGAAYR